MSDNGGHFIKCLQLSELFTAFGINFGFLEFTSIYCILYNFLYIFTLGNYESNHRWAIIGAEAYTEMDFRILKSYNSDYSNSLFNLGY